MLIRRYIFSRYQFHPFNYLSLISLRDNAKTSISTPNVLPPCKVHQSSTLHSIAEPLPGSILAPSSKYPRGSRTRGNFQSARAHPSRNIKQRIPGRRVRNFRQEVRAVSPRVPDSLPTGNRKRGGGRRGSESNHGTRIAGSASNPCEKSSDFPPVSSR